MNPSAVYSTSDISLSIETISTWSILSSENRWRRYFYHTKKRPVAAEEENNESSCYRCNRHGGKRTSQGASSARSGCTGVNTQAAQPRYVSRRRRDRSRRSD